MRKLAAIAVLFAWIPFCGNPLRGQTPGVRIEAGKNQKQQAEPGTRQPGNTQIGTVNSPLIVDIKQHPKSETETAEDKRINGSKEYRDRWTFRITVVGTVISGLLLFIGTGGVYAAVRTLRAIETQAKLMEQQARLMEAGMKQWVELDGWKSELVPDSGKLAISFQVSNPTNFLLTAEQGQITFEKPAAKIIFIYRAAPLAPNRPLAFQFSIPIEPAGMQALQAGKTIGFSVDGEIVFRTALEMRVPQSFSGLITSNLHETKFEAVVALGNPRSSSDQDRTQQNPN